MTRTNAPGESPSTITRDICSSRSSATRDFSQARCPAVPPHMQRGQLVFQGLLRMSTRLSQPNLKLYSIGLTFWRGQYAPSRMQFGCITAIIPTWIGAIPKWRGIDCLMATDNVHMVICLQMAQESSQGPTKAHRRFSTRPLPLSLSLGQARQLEINPCDCGICRTFWWKRG